LILGIGIDIVEVDRMERVLSRTGERFLERVFTGEERRQCEGAGGGGRRWAARFAGKEAVLKALGTGLAQGIGWHDVEVLREEGGPPRARLSGRAAEVLGQMGGERCLLSLTHQKGMAAAVAILEGAGSGGGG
jgi:holo-[acyl-carrier protein] synthase